MYIFGKLCRIYRTVPFKGAFFMKYKILVNGRNPAMLMDFIQRTDSYFKTLSTSDCWQDILGHFELFDPDAYVCFVDSIYSKILTQNNTLKSSEFYNGAPVIVIADAETCQTIEIKHRYSVDLIIRRPISPDNLTLRIIRHFDELKEKREEREAKQAAIEAKIAEALAKEDEEDAAIAAEIEAERAGKAAAAANSGEKKHILVVDDDRTVLKMLKTALEDQYDVTTMVNGIVVEKFLMSKKVDLIILDYEMPMETGADIYRKIKKNPKAANIPVCFLTGVSDREKVMEIMSLKPHGYLLKPIDMDMLFSTISNLTN